MEPLFSIIIPHYNIPDLLMRCLKSIPVTEDIQVVVVDDNSPDGDTYLERYAELSRPYLEFVRTTKGGGAGYARNIGMEHAKGKWLLFADADDLYVDGMYDIICQWVDSDADIVFFKIQSVMSDNLNQEISRMTYFNDYINEYLSTGDERYVRLRHSVPWGKLCRRDFVASHGFLYDEVKYSNDYYFAVCIGYYARKIEVTETVLYIYTTRKGALTESFNKKPGELVIRADVAFRIQKMFKDLKIDIDQKIPLKWYLLKLIKTDRPLFQQYWKRVDEVYPSKYEAFQILSKDKSLKFKIKLLLYSMWLWLRL